MSSPQFTPHHETLSHLANETGRILSQSREDALRQASPSSVCSRPLSDHPLLTIAPLGPISDRRSLGSPIIPAAPGSANHLAPDRDRRRQAVRGFAEFSSFCCGTGSWCNAAFRGDRCGPTLIRTKDQLGCGRPYNSPSFTVGAKTRFLPCTMRLTTRCSAAHGFPGATPATGNAARPKPCTRKPSISVSAASAR